MRIVGEYFGNDPSAISIEMGDGSSCLNLNLISSNEIRCDVDVGLGKSMDLIITLYNQVKSIPNIIPSNPPYRWGRMGLIVEGVHNLGLMGDESIPSLLNQSLQCFSFLL